MQSSNGIKSCSLRASTSSSRYTTYVAFPVISQSDSQPFTYEPSPLYLYELSRASPFFDSTSIATSYKLSVMLPYLPLSSTTPNLLFLLIYEWRTFNFHQLQDKEAPADEVLCGCDGKKEGISWHFEARKGSNDQTLSFWGDVREWAGAAKKDLQKHNKLD